LPRPGDDYDDSHDSANDYNYDDLTASAAYDDTPPTTAAHDGSGHCGSCPCSDRIHSHK
jgi:hypothetical protein